MNSRFELLSALTIVFQIICGLALAIGIVLVIAGINAAHEPLPTSSNPFMQAPAAINQISSGITIWIGAVLSLYGLAGLVFSGGVTVLIAVDYDTHKIADAMPAIVAALQKPATTSALQATVNTAADPTIKPIVAQAPMERRCSACNANNQAAAQYCENCGQPLQPSAHAS